MVWHEHGKRRKPQRSGMCPVVEYVDRNGRATTFRAFAREDATLPPIGQEVRVIRLPEVPWAFPHPLAAPYAVVATDIRSDVHGVSAGDLARHQFRVGRGDDDVEVPSVVRGHGDADRDADGRIVVTDVQRPPARR